MWDLVNISSKTEPESKGPSVHDEESEEIIANQARLPEFQHDTIESSPPSPVGDKVNDDMLNNVPSNDNMSYNNGEFFARKNVEKLTSQLTKDACSAQVSADEGKTCGVIDADIVLSLGNKVRRNS